MALKEIPCNLNAKTKFPVSMMDTDSVVSVNMLILLLTCTFFFSLQTRGQLLIQQYDGNL